MKKPVHPSHRGDMETQGIQRSGCQPDSHPTGEPIRTEAASGIQERKEAAMQTREQTHCPVPQLSAARHLPDDPVGLLWEFRLAFLPFSIGCCPVASRACSRSRRRRGAGTIGSRARVQPPCRRGVSARRRLVSQDTARYALGEPYTRAHQRQIAASHAL